MNEEYIDNVKELIEEKDADKVKELLIDLHPADIAELCNELNPKKPASSTDYLIMKQLRMYLSKWMKTFVKSFSTSCHQKLLPNASLTIWIRTTQ